MQTQPPSILLNQASHVMHWYLLCVQALAKQLSNKAAEHASSCEDDSLPPLQRAQVRCAQMAAAVELATCLAQLQGEDFEHHDELRTERTMLEAYKKRVQEAVNKQDLGSHKRKLEIDVNAAHRFITHAIPDLSSEAKQELKQVRMNEWQQRQRCSTLLSHAPHGELVWPQYAEAAP